METLLYSYGPLRLFHMRRFLICVWPAAGAVINNMNTHGAHTSPSIRVGAMQSKCINNIITLCVCGLWVLNNTVTNFQSFTVLYIDSYCYSTHSAHFTNAPSFFLHFYDGLPVWLAVDVRAMHSNVWSECIFNFETCMQNLPFNFDYIVMSLYNALKVSHALSLYTFSDEI